MKHSDIGVVAIMYGVCAFFCVMTLKLPRAAQVYPLCLEAGLALLNTLYLGRCILRLRREGGGGLKNDLPEIFRGFQAGQFFFVALAGIAALFLMRWAGFYIAALAFLAGVMLFLKVPKKHLLITVGVLAILIYAVFTLFLKVPLPKGSLFG